jgi:hypothetical protein
MSDNPSIAANVDPRDPTQLAPEYASCYYDATLLVEKSFKTIISRLIAQRYKELNGPARIKLTEQILYIQTKIALLDEERALFREAMSKRN